MVAIYVVASLCVVGMLLIAVISMFGGGNSGSAAVAEERMERRRAKLDQQETGDQQGRDQQGGDQQETGDAPAPTPLPTASERKLDDAA